MQRAQPSPDGLRLHVEYRKVGTALQQKHPANNSPATRSAGAFFHLATTGLPAVASSFAVPPARYLATTCSFGQEPAWSRGEQVTRQTNCCLSDARRHTPTDHVGISARRVKKRCWLTPVRPNCPAVAYIAPVHFQRHHPPHLVLARLAAATQTDNKTPAAWAQLAPGERAARASGVHRPRNDRVHRPTSRVLVTQRRNSFPNKAVPPAELGERAPPRARAREKQCHADWSRKIGRAHV